MAPQEGPVKRKLADEHNMKYKAKEAATQV